MPGCWARFRALPVAVIWTAVALASVFVLSAAREISGADPLTGPSTFRSALQLSMPIALAGLGGLWAERAGIVNIGLEGMMILGTWFGAWGAIEYGPWQGVLLGIVGGALGGLLHAVATVSFGVDHIVSGVAINLLGDGVARFLTNIAYEGSEQGVAFDPGGRQHLRRPGGGDCRREPRRPEHLLRLRPRPHRRGLHHRRVAARPPRDRRRSR